MLDPKRPSESTVEMNELILPQHTNSLGGAFGGVIMSWIDIAAALTAKRHARRVCVTASMDQLDFIAPIREDELVTLKAMVNAVGRSSMEVGVRVEAEDTLTGERRHAASAYLTFVALDDQGKPTEVPKLLIENEVQALRLKEAEARREQRLALAEARKRLQREH
ncbi:MAG: acyl-CoA thioesterase [Myxococcales bacterium]|nr:acyl-CoA thioesterase [Myxococcales bacterium]